LVEMGVSWTFCVGGPWTSKSSLPELLVSHCTQSQ
jgi:hypothetical protein